MENGGRLWSIWNDSRVSWSGHGSRGAVVLVVAVLTWLTCRLGFPLWVRCPVFTVTSQGRRQCMVVDVLRPRRGDLFYLAWSSYRLSSVRRRRLAGGSPPEPPVSHCLPIGTLISWNCLSIGTFIPWNCLAVDDYNNNVASCTVALRSGYLSVTTPSWVMRSVFLFSLFFVWPTWPTDRPGPINCPRL